jgi:predicted RNA-binding protein with RPS1 domain
VNFLGSKRRAGAHQRAGAGRVGKTTDVVNVGDAVKVKVIGFDERGKVKLDSRRRLPAPRVYGQRRGTGAAIVRLGRRFRFFRYAPI